MLEDMKAQPLPFPPPVDVPGGRLLRTGRVQVPQAPVHDPDARLREQIRLHRDRVRHLRAELATAATSLKHLIATVGGEGHHE